LPGAVTSLFLVKDSLFVQYLFWHNLFSNTCAILGIFPWLIYKHIFQMQNFSIT